MDGERLRRIIEAKSVAEAFKMLGDYGYNIADTDTIDGFIIAETNRLIEFIAETVASERAANALVAPFWYNNVKLAYKSRFTDVPQDGYYATPLDAHKIADGDYSDADKFLTAALERLDEADERKPQAIDLAITRAMYGYVLSCGAGVIKKYFRAEIDLKNILTAARMRRLGVNRDEFISGGKIAKSTLSEAVNAEDFSELFSGTPYAAMTEELEANDFSALWSFERDADDCLFFLTDSPCARIATYEPFLNFYAQQLAELKTVKTALVCIKTNSRDVFYARMPRLYAQ